MNRTGPLLFILAAIQFTHIVDFMIMMPLGPQLMRVFNISPQEFSFLVSAYTFSAGISGLLVSMIIDRFDRKVAMIISFSGFLLGTLACAVAPEYWILLASRCITGAFGGVLGSLVLAIISDAVEEKRRGKAIGTVMAAFSVASVAGVPFGLFIASKWDWHAPFFFLVGISVIILVLIILIIPSMRDHIDQADTMPSPFEIFPVIARDRNMLNAILFTILLILGQFSVIPFIAPYMVSNVGFSEDDLVFIYLIGGGLTIFSSPAVGRLSDRIGKPRTFTIFALLVLIPIFLVTHLPEGPMWQALVVTSMFFVFANGRMVPATSMVTAVVVPQHRAGFMSVRTAFLQFSSAIGTTIAGMIIIEHPNGALERYNWVGYGAIIIGVACVWVGRKLKVVQGA